MPGGSSPSLSNEAARSRFSPVGRSSVATIRCSSLPRKFIDMDSAANFVPVNTADNWLHFALGAAMIALGLLLGRRTTTTTDTAPGTTPGTVR
ncbi:hypothetical protein CJ177_44390 [Rhodococcus sp. ACPA1]|nr:hypothetical protein CJ177_44390 [Rhodococcus sp. ACPA1]